MNQNKKASIGIEKRRRLSPKEYDELHSQLEAGDTGPSFHRMQEALEARNWTFLYDCSLSHMCLSTECSRVYIYHGIAAARLGRSNRLCNVIFCGWSELQEPSDLAKEAATVSMMLGQSQYSLAFFAIHQLLFQRKAGQVLDSPELVECFRNFLKAANIKPSYKSQHPKLLLPYYFTLLIREVAERIPTPSDSLDRHY